MMEDLNSILRPLLRQADAWDWLRVGIFLAFLVGLVVSAVS